MGASSIDVKGSSAHTCSNSLCVVCRDAGTKVDLFRNVDAARHVLSSASLFFFFFPFFSSLTTFDQEEEKHEIFFYRSVGDFFFVNKFSLGV